MDLPVKVAKGEKRIEAKLSHDEIVEGMRALRKRVKPGKTNVRQMVNEGRRF